MAFFGTDGIRSRVGSAQMNPEFILKLAMVTAQVLSEEISVKNRVPKVVIGRDTRRSGKLFEAALQAGFNAMGVDVFSLGVMPTPAVAYLTRAFCADLGVVISASHNPYDDNGIKFFSSTGCKISDDLESKIEAGLRKEMPKMSKMIGKSETAIDAAGRYIEFCKSAVPHFSRLSDLTLVVDCAHGATAHIAPLVFEELGAKVFAIGNTPDGFNINDGVGSTSPGLLCQKVKEHQADIGIAFDGDGDRVILVNEKGEVVDGDEILYILAVESQRNGRLGSSGVVGTQMSNWGLEQALEKKGIPFERTWVGDRHVMAKLHEKQWLIGGESSGHIIWLSSTTTGDGIVAALQVLSVMQSQKATLSKLLSDYQKAPQILRNVPLPEGELIQESRWEALLKEADEATLSLKGKGRVLLRKSGTEPLIRIMVEGENLAEAKVLAEIFARKLQ